MPRLLAFLSLVVLIGLAVWLIFSPPERAKTDNYTNPAEIEQPELETVPDLNDGPQPSEEIVDTLQRTDIDPINLGGKDPNVEYGEPVEEGILVTVVDADGGELLPFAEVMVLDMGVIDQSTFQMEMRQQPDFESVFAHFGVVYPTDKSAQVKIPFPEGDLLLAGRTDSHFDFSMSMEATDEEMELAIKRVALLRIHVVDGKGVPVEGAPVGLRMKQDAFSQDMMRNFTNEQGWTNLRLFNLLLERLPADGTYAALMGLFEKPVEKLVDLHDLPKEGVELVMPATGSLTVTVLDQQGAPLEEYVGVLLNIIDPDAGPQEFNEEDQPDLVDTTRTGQLTIPAVGLGLDILVKATSVNGVLSGSQVVEGPTATNPDVSVEITVGMEAAVIKGRLVNEEGKPGPNISLRSRMELEHENGSSSTSSSVRTDEEGYFKIRLDNSELSASATRTLTLTMKATRKKPERDAVIDLSRSFPPGETDLGDIMVIAPPLAASGRVLKPDGTPLRDAEISLERHVTYGEGPDDFYWENLYNKRARSDQDGYFNLAGRFEPDRYRLRVSSARYPSVYQPARLGEEGLEITMAAGGGLMGVLLLDKEISRDEVSLRMERQQDSASNGDVLSGFGLNMESTGKFQDRGLTPGTYNIVLTCDNTDEELFRQDNIIVNLSDDGAATDVGQIDLRGQLRAFQLKLRDEEDKVVRDARVTIGDSDQSNYVWEGRIDVITAKPQLDFTITSDGYRRVELQGVSEDSDVIFKAGIKVRLRVANPDAIPSGYSIKLNLRSAAPNSRSAFIHSTGSSLNASHEQVVSAMESGSFYVDAQLSRDEGEQSNTWWGVSAPAEGALIQVEDLGGEQFFTIQLNADSIAGIVNRIEE